MKNKSPLYPILICIKQSSSASPKKQAAAPLSVAAFPALKKGGTFTCPLEILIVENELA